MKRPWSCPENYWLAGLCFILSIPSAGSLLAKVYGIMPMKIGVLCIAAPSTAIVIAICLYARKTGREQLCDLLRVGCFAGLVSTFAYDISRVPFHILGQRIFAPISAYGVWIADTQISSRFTETIGWSYHFWNGIMFGIMYLLFMFGRNWFWAVIWGCLLETIAFMSPFGRIFSLWGNYPALAIAYMGHVAYGIPLGFIGQKWQAVNTWLKSIPPMFTIFFLLLGLLGLANPILNPDNAAADADIEQRTFKVRNEKLNPDWIRIQRGETIKIDNQTTQPVKVSVSKKEQSLEPKAQTNVSFEHTGVFPVALVGERRSRTSFVIVEPVEHEK